MIQPLQDPLFVTQNKDLRQEFSISGREIIRNAINFPTSDVSGTTITTITSEEAWSPHSLFLLILELSKVLYRY